MSDRLLGRDEAISLLQEVGKILTSKGAEATIYVVDGIAMALEYDSRRITRDVDAQIRNDTGHFWEAVSQVAHRHGLDPEWLNTSAVAFMSNEPDTATTDINLPGLRVSVASARHLIAMKLRSLRARDMDDLEVLFRSEGISSPEEAAAIHDELFGESNIGYFDPEESLYAARAVFERAAQVGRPLAENP